MRVTSKEQFRIKDLLAFLDLHRFSKELVEKNPTDMLCQSRLSLDLDLTASRRF